MNRYSIISLAKIAFFAFVAFMMGCDGPRDQETNAIIMSFNVTRYESENYMEYWNEKRRSGNDIGEASPDDSLLNVEIIGKSRVRIKLFMSALCNVVYTGRLIQKGQREMELEIMKGEKTGEHPFEGLCATRFDYEIKINEGDPKDYKFYFIQK